MPCMHYPNPHFRIEGLHSLSYWECCWGCQSSLGIALGLKRAKPSSHPFLGSSLHLKTSPLKTWLLCPNIGHLCSAILVPSFIHSFHWGHLRPRCDYIPALLDLPLLLPFSAYDSPKCAPDKLLGHQALS